MDKMEYLRDLLKAKEGLTLDIDDQKRITVLKSLLKNDNVFFELDMPTAINILAFLGIPETEIKNFYLSLISPEQFQKTSKPYFSLNNRQ